MGILDFFEEEEVPQRESTPTLTEVLKLVMEHSAMEMRVSMPAEVMKYDHKKQMVDVKPFFKRKHQDGTVKEPPMIYNVPVAFPRAGKAFISMPIDIGHNVLLVFADRSMDKWLSNGERNDPEDTRNHHMSDAIAIPGCYPFSDPAPVNNSKDVIVKNDNLEMRVKPNGHVQIINQNYELIKVLEEWMNASISGAHHYKIAIRQKFRTFLEK